MVFLGPMVEGIAESENGSTYHEFEFRRRLADAGLTSVEIEFVLSKTLDIFTWNDVVKKLGYTNKDAARYAWKKIVQKLRKVGYRGR